jgi:6-phosphogluconolactonase
LGTLIRLATDPGRPAFPDNRFKNFFRESRMLKKAAALLLVYASVGTWAGCGKIASGYVYAALPTPSQIAIYREDPNSGVLTALVGSPFPAGPGVQSLLIHPSGQFMYGANSGQSNVSLFTIASNGLLSEQGRTTVIGTPLYLAMDTAGAYLYVGCVGPNSISVFSINSSGGTLTQVGTYQIGLPPLNMALTPSAGFLYVTGSTASDLPGVVQAFSVSSGVLTPIQGSPFETGKTPQGLAITPNGNFLYTANFGDGTLSEFSIGSDGTLTPLEGSPVGETYLGPIALLVDNSGQYLYVANKTSGNVAAYSISSSGTLLLLSNSPFGAGGNPGVIASDPSGQYLFVGTQASAPQVQSFYLYTNSGTLTSVANYNTGNAPTSIAVLHPVAQSTQTSGTTP